jgi:hypothetical protein
MAMIAGGAPGPAPGTVNKSCWLLGSKAKLVAVKVALPQESSTTVALT